MYGYKCTLLTDTEVITYIIDYLHAQAGADAWRRSASVIAAPFWCDHREDGRRRSRNGSPICAMSSASLLITGPFSILLGFDGGMMALNDRLKLRSMVVGEKDEMVYIASEECAIRIVEPELDRIWAPARRRAGHRDGLRRRMNR